MTIAQVKTEIQNVLAHVPETVLPDILVYLKQIQNQSTEQVKLNANFKRILSEDKVLLQKLAE